MRVKKNVKATATVKKSSKSTGPGFRVAIAGAGARATSFIDYFVRNSGHGQVVGLCDTIPEKAQRMAQYFGIEPQIFDDVQTMLETLKPDALFVCTPDCAHVKPAVTALKMNIHVFCEKPMATTLKDCDAIIAAVKQSKAAFYLGFNLRHSPMHETIHQLITDGRLGKITTIEANEYYHGGRTFFRRWNRFEKFSGGLWLSKASHDFDLLNWMAGAEPENVFASANLSQYQKKPQAAKLCRDCALKYECPDYVDIANIGNSKWDQFWGPFCQLGEKYGRDAADLCLYNSDKDTFDNGMAIVTYQNDIRTTYTVNVLSARLTRQMRVVGTRAMAEGDMMEGTVNVTDRYTQRQNRYDLKSLIAGGHGGADDRMIRDFLHTCETGKKPKCSWSEGRLAVQVALAARESCQKNKMIVIDNSTKVSRAGR